MDRLTPISRVEHFLARIAGDPGKVLNPKTRIENFLQRIIDSGGGGGGGGAVSSVNGRTGAVVLNATDVGAAPAEVNVTIADTAAVIEPEDNHVYICGELANLKIIGAPSSGNYSIVFTSGASPTVTSIPSSILGLENFAPEANTIYEINVLDNRAVIGSWAVSA